MNANAMAAGVAASLAVLSEYNFIFLGDASGSMGEPVKAGSNLTRWQSMQETALSFARDLEQVDSDGIDVVFFGGTVSTSTGVTADRVKEVFAQRSPRGSTPLAQALTAALSLNPTSNKKKFLLVFTDGVPDDEKEVENVIRAQAARQTNDDECTILFVQVGDDAHAAAYLRKLDDQLTGAKFDIVDAKTVDEANAFPSTLELVAHAIND